MRPGSRTAPDLARILRNLGLAYLAGAPLPDRPLSPSELALSLGLPRSTVRDCLAAAGPLVRTLAGDPGPPADHDQAGEDPADRAERSRHNAARRRTRPDARHDHDSA